MFTCLLEILLHKLSLTKKVYTEKRKSKREECSFPVKIIKNYFKVIIDREYSRFRPTTLEGWRAKTFQEETTAATSRSVFTKLLVKTKTSIRLTTNSLHYQPLFLVLQSSYCTNKILNNSLHLVIAIYCW